MDRPANPYIAGDPVSGSDRFIGRGDVLQDVLRMLRHRHANAIVLYGQRRIGKTSILLHLAAQLAETEEYIPVYFDLQDKASLSLADLLHQLAQKVADKVGADAPAQSQFDRAGEFFRDTFLPQIAARISGQSVVLFFDEFDVLDSPQKGQAGESFFPYLRGWMSQAGGVNFVFVLGRRPEDLSIDTLSAFKQVGRRQVSLMNREDSLDIIHQSQRNGSLNWTAAGTERVWQWTQGHPYLTQLLCSEVWEAAYDEEPETPPSIDASDVDAALDDALELGEHAFLWIWNGLPPAERIVMAAMSELENEVINQEELARILNRSGVRLILRELELAPETLVQWDLLRPADGGFRFAVPLLRRWVAANKPLRRVKLELDRLEPLAENLYQSAEGFYGREGMQDLEEAERLLRRALDVNPNHMRARLLLGRVLLGQGDPAGAVQELEPVYSFDPPLARQGLIGALLALGESQESENRQLAAYDRVLTIEAEQPVAQEKRRAIWQQRAERALAQGAFETAKEAYEQIEDTAGIARVQEAQRRLELERRVHAAETKEAEEDWAAAATIYVELLAELPQEKAWQARLEEARKQARLTETYGRALQALQNNNTEQAQRLFAEVIATAPAYKEAARYLLMTTTGIDVRELADQAQASKNAIAELTPKLEAETAQRRQLEQEVAWLQGRLEADSQQRQAAPEPREQTLPDEKEQNPIGRLLSLWNPLDYLRLLWWILARPKLFKSYEQSLDATGKMSLERQSNWLSSTLTWWPLVIWVAWPLFVKNIEDLKLLLICGLLAAIGLTWLLIGACGHRDSDWVSAVMGVAAVGVTGSIAGVVVRGVEGSLTLGIAVAIVLGTPIAIALSVAVSVDSYSVDTIIVGVACTLASGSFIGLIGGGGVEVGIALSLSLVTFGLYQKQGLKATVLIGLIVGLTTGSTFLWISQRLTANTWSSTIISIAMGSVVCTGIIGIVIFLARRIRRRLENT